MSCTINIQQNSGVTINKLSHWLLFKIVAHFLFNCSIKGLIIVVLCSCNACYVSYVQILQSYAFHPIRFQMRDLYAGLCIWWPHPVPAVYAHLPHGLYRRLADEVFHLPFLHGACGCCPALHLWDQLIPPTPTLRSNTAPLQSQNHTQTRQLSSYRVRGAEKYVLAVVLHFENFKISWTNVSLS